MLESNKEKEDNIREAEEWVRNEYLAPKDTTIAHCPKCGSSSLSSDKKGFSATKAIAGTLLIDPLAGVVAGNAGKNKVIVTCLKCGHQWKAGKK